METSANHLCELLKPCCLEKISKSVVSEILVMIINILFFSIVIESITIIIFSIIKYFYPSVGACTTEENCSILTQNTNEIPKQNVLPKSSTSSKSKISDIFSKSNTITSYDFNF
jgi:hypothetical protein